MPDTATAPLWTLVGRKGERSDVELAEGLVVDYASAAAKAFGVGENRRVHFDKTRAKEDAQKAGTKAKAS